MKLLPYSTTYLVEEHQFYNLSDERSFLDLKERGDLRAEQTANKDNDTLCCHLK